MTEQEEPSHRAQPESAHQDGHRDAGRLELRLEQARANLHEVRGVLSERQDLRADIERAITELERAITKAAPRFQ